MPRLRARSRVRAGDWEGAASALEAAVARDGTDAALRLRLATAYERARRWDDAAEALRAAVVLDGRRPRLHVRLAEALEQSARWGEAADAYRAALARDDSRKRWHMRLGRTLELSHDLDGAHAAYEAGLDRDRQTTERDRKMLALNTERFPVRRRLTRFVERHLDEIRERAARPYETPSGPPRVWVYWGQGIESAPPIVRRCHEELLRHHAPGEVVLLDDGLVPHYVDIPEVVRRRTARRRTKFSDVLRFELLSRYGGIWLDATCLVRGRILDRLPELLPSGFFAFRRKSTFFSSWFLAAEAHDPAAAMVREAQYKYWERFRHPIDHYVLHDLCEGLYHVADDFRERYDAMPRQSASPAHRLASALLDPYDPVRCQELLDGCFVHKLTYKYPVERVNPDTLVAHLVRGDVPGRGPSVS